MPDEMRSSALISPCEQYRYALHRVWDDSLPDMMWVMLNPSTADHQKDDPTIRRCINYARDWGYGGITVTNLFALRATDPRMLYSADDPIGPDNDHNIIKHAKRMLLAVAAWGTHGEYRGRGRKVHAILKDQGIHLTYLRLTKGGQPSHPLRLPRTLKPIPYNPDQEVAA